MTYVRINDTLYPATVVCGTAGGDWDFRPVAIISIEADVSTVANLFVDGAKWSEEHHFEAAPDPETGEMVTPESHVWDRSEYCLAGEIVDRRAGTVTVKMGKPTREETLEAENAALLFELLTGEVLA